MNSSSLKFHFENLQNLDYVKIINIHGLGGEDQNLHFKKNFAPPKKRKEFPAVSPGAHLYMRDWAAIITDFIPDAHTLLIVVASVVSGSPTVNQSIKSINK